MRFEFRFESLKSISVLILFVYKLMIGSSKNNRENYLRKCFWTQEKETRVKFNPGLSANQPSNNWALKSIEVITQGKCIDYWAWNRTGLMGSSNNHYIMYITTHSAEKSDNEVSINSLFKTLSISLSKWC